MLTSSKYNVQLLLSHCLAAGINDVVFSPGSRNAPLIVAFNQHPEMNCHVVPDERSAAFVALGMAQQLKKGVAIVCTSGSAPLNYYPAIAEAHYQCIPLIVITADRPSEWINQGDGQTIMQQNVFQNHVRYFVQMEDLKFSKTNSWKVQRELSQAFLSAFSNSKGPIHINVALEEPLYETIVLNELPKIQNLRKEVFIHELTGLQKDHIKTAWEKYPKKMVLCGQMEINLQVVNLINELSNDSSVLILVENTSNIYGKNCIHCIDRLLNSISEEQIAAFEPDLLITLGGAIVSKKIKTLLRKSQLQEHWKVGFDFPFMDTYQQLSHSFEIDTAVFVKELIKNRVEFPVNYATKWKQLDYLIQDKQTEYFAANEKLSDITAFHIILDSIPDSVHLHLANSSVIRYTQLFDPIKTVNYWCNRGTSGIDGSTSTAVGAALANPEENHVFITGDMSFFYDSNAFWNHLNKSNLRIFLINNGGGGIFKIIPGPDKTKELDTFFVYNNNFTAENICKTFGLNYFAAYNLEEIDNQLAEFYTLGSTCAVMEIFTTDVANEKELLNYFEKVRID